MNRRSRRLAAVVATTIATAGALAVAVAGAVTPPAGTPDLAQMTLQLSDLAPGASAAGSYSKPPKSFIAQYERTFTGASSTGGVPLYAIQAQLLLARTAANATSSFRTLRLVYGTKLGRALIAAAIAKGAGKAFNPKNVHFGKLASIGVGNESLLEPITLGVAGRRLAAAFVVVRVDRVLLNLSVLVRRPKLARSVMSGLASAVAAHITAVLAASGPTGPTGSTGATG